MIGPSCSIADVKGDKVTIWSGPQGPFRTRGTVATLLGLKEQNVRIIYHEASGSYGRMSTDDGAEDAALFRAPPARRCAFNGRAKMSMAGNRKARRSWMK